MICQVKIFLKGHLSHPFVLNMYHKSNNLVEKCMKCSNLHSSVSTSGLKSGIIRLSLSGTPKGVDCGFGTKRAKLLCCTSSAATAIHSSKKWHPNKQTVEQSQSKTNYTFLRAKQINNCRVVLPSGCDFVQSYSNKTSENSLKIETLLNNHSDASPDGSDSRVSNPPGILPQELEIVKKSSKFSNDIEDDFEAETDFVYGGRRERTNVELYSNAMSHLLTHDDGGEAPLPSEIRAENIKALSHLISSAETCFDVFHIYEKHQNQLNFLHYDLIVKRLTKVIDRTPLDEVYSHATFVQFCDRLCKNCCQYDPPMLLSLLQMLNTIKLSPRALIMLTTLQMLRKKFDTLDVKELLFLDDLLSSNQQGPLGYALKKAVPLALECLYSNLELPSSLEPSHLSHGLLLCSTGETTEHLELAEKFMMALYGHEQGVDDLDVSEAVTLIRGLVEVVQRWKSTPGRQQLDFKDQEDPLLPSQSSLSNSELFAEEFAVTREVLLHEALTFVAENLSQLSDLEVEQLQRLLSGAYSKGDRSAHCQPLLDAFVRRVLEQDGSIQALAAGVAWMLRMDAVEESLVQALLEKLLLAPSEELCRPELPVIQLIHALAATDAFHGRPREQCHALLEKLLQHPSAQLQSQDSGPASLTRLGVDLACLGYFEPLLHDTVLDCAAAHARLCLDGSSAGSGVRQLMALCRAQRLLAAQPCSVQVDEELLSENKRFLLNDGHQPSVHSSERSLVRQLLQHALSSHGPDGVVTRVHTRHGGLIDHVLVVRGSDEVVSQPEAAASQGSVCLDDLAVPEGSRVIGVVQVGPGLLLNTCSTMRPLVHLELQLLAAEGVTVVPLIMSRLMLYCRSDADQLAFVLEALRQHNLCL